MLTLSTISPKPTTCSADLNLNTDKSGVCHFSTWPNSSTWNPTIFIGTQKICLKITPCLLGVILDRSLMLTTHLKKLTALLSSSICIIWATARASWDWCHSTLKMACHTLIHNKLNYTAPAWQPQLSVTSFLLLSCLDYPKNCSLRHITGQLVFTPLEALQLEAYVQSYHTCSNDLILKAREKTLCSTNSHPKCVALAADIPQRLQNCSSFCWKPELSTLLSPKLQHRQNIIHFPSPPWQHCNPHERRIITTVPGITGWADDIDLKC